MIKLKNRKGASLVTAIGVFLLVTLLAVVITNILTTNVTAARRQREFTQAHYLALAGIEIGSSAVLRRGVNDGEFPVLYYFQNFTGDFNNLVFTETIRFGPDVSGLTPTHAELPDFNASKVEIWIRPVNSDGTRITGTNPSGTVWIEVLVRSTFYNNGQFAALTPALDADETFGTRHAMSVRFNTTQPEWNIREIVNPNDAARFN